MSVPSMTWVKLTSPAGQHWWVWQDSGYQRVAQFDGTGSLMLDEGRWWVRTSPPPHSGTAEGCG